MLFAVPFFHSPGECPRLHKAQEAEHERRFEPTPVEVRALERFSARTRAGAG